ncbi:hypothetical protein [Priestia megaterium]|uniref:hypothetical protein n=1 Tax=Priestia megaterium TaxID=1404 RepID=UPI002E224201|nr:hypothetical protein [Priestia megaterium]
MDKQREKFVQEMKRMEEAIERTNSEYLKYDYTKALKRMKLELAYYDKFKGGKK